MGLVISGYSRIAVSPTKIYEEVGLNKFPCNAPTQRLVRTQIRGEALCPGDKKFLESIAIFNDRQVFIAYSFGCINAIKGAGILKGLSC